jgi:hypothetical protein
MPTPRRSRRLLVGGAWAAVALQLLALYLPEAPAAALGLPFADKVVHAGVFGLATALWARVVGRAWPPALEFAAHAIISELVQAALLPGRSGDPADVAADLAGVALGLAAARKPPWGRVRPPGPVGPNRPARPEGAL